MCGSISIISFKGVWIVPLKKEIDLQTRLGPLLEFQNRIILASVYLHLVRRSEISASEEGNGTVPRMCPKCGHSSPFQSHTRGIGVRMWLI